MDAKQFRDALDELGVSQRRFARMINMDITTVHRWSLGKASIPGIAETCVCLLLTLHRTHQKLLGPGAESARP